MTKSRDLEIYHSDTLLLRALSIESLAFVLKSCLPKNPKFLYSTLRFSGMVWVYRDLGSFGDLGSFEIDITVPPSEAGPLNRLIPGKAGLYKPKP